MISKIKELSDLYFTEIVKIRRHLHKHPELSFYETETSKYIKDVLNQWEIPFFEGIANNGIVVNLEGKDPLTSIIALRADFDALPIEEKNDVSYRSINKGVMHACGHDAHTASLLGAIRILNNLKDYWKGTIKFIFQPAEEMLPGGAKQMIEEGVLENPKVQRIIAQHVFPDLEVGKVGFCRGKYMASTDELHITIKGKGGHAALPEDYTNPILVAMNLISQLDSYFKDQQDYKCVFAIGFVEALGSTNIIPNSVKLKGTFRAMDESFRARAHEIMRATTNNLLEGDIDINFDIRKGYPCLINDNDLTNRAISFAKEYMGEDNVVDLPIRMTAEDFAYYSQLIPSCFYRLGTANIKRGITAGLHTSKFNIDEESLRTGMGLMAYLAIQNLTY